jgi:hypothetical protein
MTLTPVLSSNVTPPNVAWQNSWVSVPNDQNRPLFAQASYLVNPNDISISLSATNINVDLNQTNAGIQTVNTNLSNLLNYNNFIIPPFNNIAVTNDGNGNPRQYDYSLNGTIVATLSCTYDGNNYLTNIRQIL